MSSLRSEPFLWIHLSGIALFPAFLELVWIGLGVGSPWAFSTIELWLVAVIGIVPVLWMQLARPFDIFSILMVSLKPERLTPEQRQILRLFKTAKQRWLSAIAAGLMLLILWLLYRLAPVAVGVASLLPQWRILGLVIASIAFLGSNLFLQIPLSVGSILSNNKLNLAAIEPYPVEKIERDFTVPGLKVNQILGFIKTESQPNQEV